MPFIGPPLKKSIKEICFEEWKVTRQLSTGNGEYYMTQTDIPAWFVAYELGFGPGETDNIAKTLNKIHNLNRNDPPKVKIRRTSTPANKRKKLRLALKRRLRRGRKKNG